MNTMRLLGPAMLALLCCAAAHAQPHVVIYRCTAASGAVTVQNDKPCPKGSKQEKRVVDTPPSSPAARPAPSPAPAPVVPVVPANAPYAPPPAPAAPTPSTYPAPSPPSSNYPTPPVPQGNPPDGATPMTAASEPQPPPALFECRTYDNSSYFSEIEQPAPRCAPLTTTGVGGTAPPAGAACQMVTDQCQRVADAALCDGWRQHLRELQSNVSFGRADEQESASTDLDRAKTLVRESTCGP